MRVCLLLLLAAACDFSVTAKGPLPSQDAAVAVAGPSRDGLVAWWHFDDRGDPYRDEGGGVALVARGGAQVSGKVGLAYDFDGATCLTAADSPAFRGAGASALSVAAWVRVPSGGCPQDRLDAGYVNVGVIFSKDGEYEHGVYCGPTPAYQHAVSTDGAGGEWLWRGSAPVSTGDWHHVATAWDGAAVRLYVDGTLAEARVLTGVVRPAFGSSGVGVGCGGVPADGASTAMYNFVGTIDEVLVYRRALSAEEVAAYYGATR